MMKRQLLCSLFIFSFTLFSWAQEIKLNQVGFYPNAPKKAVVRDAGTDNFEIISVSGDTTTLSGELLSANEWPYSGETVRIADFSQLNTPGSYFVRINGVDSYDFNILPNVHEEVMKASAKAFYFNRASTALEEAHAGEYARAAGHPDDVVEVHSSAASEARPEGTIISSPKGWYDAGDYNKYIVNSGISTYTLLAAYEHMGDYFRETSWNIPESGQGMPDILSEALWNIEWMLTMQDPNDGGVYHKLTTAGFSGRVMPANATGTRYVVEKSTAAALNFAAVMAVASRVYADYEDEKPGFSAECLEAAQDAWAWAQNNPTDYFTNPDGIETGEYGDGNVDDEFNWAAAELYITTQEDSYYNDIDQSIYVGVPGWNSVNTLGWLSLAIHSDSLTAAADPSTIRQRVTNLADNLEDEATSSAYNVVMGEGNGNFAWGSNGNAGNQAMILTVAHIISAEQRYLNAALQNLDYMLGRNALSKSFVAGHGDDTPMNPHHRPSDADGIREPIPGFIMGGPNPGQQDECDGYEGSLPALSYVDSWCSYASNEVTINWNAPLVYTTAAMENFFGSDETATAPVFSTQPSDQAPAEGQDVSLSTFVNGATPMTFQWYMGDSLLEGETGPNLNINDFSAENAGTYRVVAQNEYDSVPSREATLTMRVQAPFNDSPIEIPGILEVEDFDEGGQNLSYFDTEETNQGGSNYRGNEFVDIGAGGSNYVVAYVEAGEWLEYTINVAESNTYNLTVTAASEQTSGSFRLAIDGEPVSEEVDIPNTEDWNEFENIAGGEVVLEEGEHVLRINMLGGGFNLDRLDFSISTSLAKHQESHANLADVYPNPFSNHVTIAPKKSSVIKVFTADGQLIEEREITSEEHIDMTRFVSSSFYIIQVISEGRQHSYKLIRNK